MRRSVTNGLNLIRGEAHAESTKQPKLFGLFVDAAHNLEEHGCCIARIQECEIKRQQSWLNVLRQIKQRHNKTPVRLAI